MKPTLIDAIVSLVPNAEVSVANEQDITWHKPESSPVTIEQINTELLRLEEVYRQNEYRTKRSAEYPPITDYLDGIVKGDQAQIDKYIADCQAVKAKYPKGS